MIREVKSIHISGTGSGVGKSIIACAMCRLFLQDGYRPAPFKAQNMALNSFVGADGGEIGRAQANQAYACRIRPNVDINPILIKPDSDRSAQIIMRGRPLKRMSVYEYTNFKKSAFNEVKASFNRLKKNYEVIVIEGAGSPAEINLKRHDIVNIRMARFAKAPIILIGDIDRGGVFASFVGTLQLLTAPERAMVKGFIINKFRGDKRLLRSGISFLEKHTGKKVLGVIPYYHGINIPEEDSLPQALKMRHGRIGKQLKIDVIALPHMSNFNDFDALAQEKDVSLSYVSRHEDLRRPDAIIIPGTKSTIADMAYLKNSGIAGKIASLYRKHSDIALIGICGGYQMLGEVVYDREGIESGISHIKGLGMLPIITRLRPEKTLSQVRAKDLLSGNKVEGYEIHHGLTKRLKGHRYAFGLLKRRGKTAGGMDGSVSENGRCWGTYIHGVFDNNTFRRHFLNGLRQNKGWGIIAKAADYDINKEIDKLSALVRRNINMGMLYDILLKR